MNHPLLGKAGETHLLLGNEAIVRGALEAGVHFISCYPGTPSSEVPDNFRQIKDSKLFRLEYAPNEKVALEVGAGAALAGALTLVTMKHVGVNVAADPLFTMTYTGLPGGLVLLSADDPGCHSSQNEQDNRNYARFAGLPCFEPATAQEAKDMCRDAFLLARELQHPVLLRTTTRVNHLRGPVTYGPLPQNSELVPFTRNPRRYVPVPAVARVLHGEQLKTLSAAANASELSPWNFEEGTGKLGIIATGIARAYLHDALLEQGWENEVRSLHLGFSWPLPEKKLAALLSNCRQILVLEEQEPLVEDALRILAQKSGSTTTIYGKDVYLTRQGEYSVSTVSQSLATVLQKKLPQSTCTQDTPLPQRPPNLCAGCSHRAVYYAVRQVFGDEAIYSSDIGCYTLGMLPPLRTADFLFCMGSSISAGSGFAAFSKDPVVAFIGDSTFFHSGMTGLANAVFNKHNLLIVILDNRTTAMTGHQPNPGVDQAVLGDDCTELDIESIVRGMGVTQLAKVRPFNVKAVTATLEEMKQASGVRVIIAEEACILYARRTLKKPRTQKSKVAEQSQSAHDCAKNLACPAFRYEEKVLSVESSHCAGCMVCLQISDAFTVQKSDAFTVQKKEG